MIQIFTNGVGVGEFIQVEQKKKYHKTFYKECLFEYEWIQRRTTQYLLSILHGCVQFEGIQRRMRAFVFKISYVFYF